MADETQPVPLSIFPEKYSETQSIKSFALSAYEQQADSEKMQLAALLWLLADVIEGNESSNTPTEGNYGHERSLTRTRMRSALQVFD